MKRFKNILYFADHTINDQTYALQRAVKIARSNQAQLTIIDVLTEAEMTRDIQEKYGLDINLMRSVQRQNELNELALPYREDGMDILCKVLMGVPFIELIKTVQRNGYDLLVKMAQGNEGIIERVFGSSDMHLLRKCPCPVWIDGPDSVHPYKNILAAVDPMDENCDELNRLIMDLSTSLAEKESANLHVVNAWQLEGETTLRSPRAGLTKPELDVLLSRAEYKHEEKLNSLLVDYDLSLESENVSLIKAAPYQGIVSRSNDLNIDLIVMGTIGRTGIPGFFIGNTAEDVLQSATCSVLAVKPKDFVSPVTPGG